MPKAPKARPTHRPTPYNLSAPTTMASQVAPYFNMPQTTPDWPPSHHLYAPQHPSMIPISEMINQIPRTPHIPPPSPSLQQPAQSGPWSNNDDDILYHARTQGLGWNQIQERHFPTKSANACRKRYERLMIRRRSTDWDEARLEKLAVTYREMRPQIWSPLAKKLGEKWEHVEKAVRQTVNFEYFVPC